jgi:hypothetical protein
VTFLGTLLFPEIVGRVNYMYITSVISGARPGRARARGAIAGLVYGIPQSMRQRVTAPLY